MGSVAFGAAFAAAIDTLAIARPATNNDAVFMTVFLPNSGTGHSIPKCSFFIPLVDHLAATNRQVGKWFQVGQFIFACLRTEQFTTRAWRLLSPCESPL